MHFSSTDLIDSSFLSLCIIVITIERNTRARDWLQTKKDDIDVKLKTLIKGDNNAVGIDVGVDTNMNAEGKTNEVDHENDHNGGVEYKHYGGYDNNSNVGNEEGGDVHEMRQRRLRMKKQKSLLENTIIASVALDASAVFEKDEMKSTSSPSSYNDPTPTTAINDNDISEEQESKSNGVVKRRKHIKAKAVDAMAKDGVDIGSYVPKTLDEILPLIKSNKGSSSFHENINSNNNNSSAITTTTTPTTTSATTQLIGNELTVDKLIVLCSCGDVLKHKLTRRSKSVEEWNIDAPTSAAKNGEGDAAYRRVSLELKNEVTILMESLIGDVLD